MANSSILIVFLILFSITGAAQLVISKPETELYLIRLRIELMIQEVYEKCPYLVDHRLFLEKRDLHGRTMAMERKIYQHVEQLLTECFSARTTSVPTVSSNNPNKIPLPPQCTSVATVNLTESYRIDASILTDILPDDADILKPGVTWFRFTGYACNLLRDTCPTAAYKCGSTGGYWSDSPIPTEVGETVNITFCKK